MLLANVAAMIDLRSDTVTTPTPDMRHAIATAEVGDDVFHTDPTVLALEERVAGILGTEDAVYVPSGTMSNQIALRTHTEPGDIVLVAENAHLISGDELGAPGALAGVTVQALPSFRGRYTAESVVAAAAGPHDRPRSSLFTPPWLSQPTTLVSAENTHNEAGGTVWPLEDLNAVAEAAHSVGLATHLDGARIWNASAATGVEPSDYATGFDTVTVCFSKALGAPIGSAMCGSAHLVERARRFKQMYGGGFRQAGLLAAAALYALEHNRERLPEDHATAARLAAGLAETPGIEIDAEGVETNLVYFEVATMSAIRLCEEVHARGAWMLPMGESRVRAVTHLGITRNDIDDTLSAIAGAVAAN